MLSVTLTSKEPEIRNIYPTEVHKSCASFRTRWMYKPDISRACDKTPLGVQRRNTQKAAKKHSSEKQYTSQGR